MDPSDGNVLTGFFLKNKMEKGDRLWSVLALLLTVTGTSCFLTAPSNSGKPPHIIFIVADDLGWNDVGWHNHDMYTPHLNKLAHNGIILNSSYVQPLCSPSRNAFMSGYYPYHTGLQHGVIKPDHAAGMPLSITTLPQRLKALNYTTHIVGKWHLGFCNWKYTPTYRGFDSFMGFLLGAEDYYNHTRENGYDFRWNKTVYTKVKGEYSTTVIARHAVDLINTIDPEKEQLYLYLPFQAVHGPLEVPHRFQHLKKYRGIHNLNRRKYCGMVSALDEAVGNITDALRNRGYMNNTLIVFTTDNGGPVGHSANNLPLRGSKATLWEGGTRGAAFVYSENLLKKTKYVNNEMIHAVDWYPTLLSLAGGTPDPAMDGVNQWPMISEGQASARTEFIYNIDDVVNNSAIRVGKYKLIQGSPGHQNTWTPLPSRRREVDQDDSAGPQHFPPYQLFDIDADPTEHHDIANQHPQVVESMKKKLDHYKASLVKANYPPSEPKANPNHFNGIWSPGWC